MNRREFLAAGRQQLAGKKKTRVKYDRYFESADSGLQPYSGDWGFDEAAHLLRRSMFGAKQSDIDHILSLTPSDAVDELLTISPVPSPPVREYGLLEMDNGMFDDPNVPQGSTWVNDVSRSEDGNLQAAVNNARTASLRRWWMGVMLNQQRSITEKMVLFWHHHFSVQTEEVDHPILLFRHLDLLRTEVLGNVRRLTRNVTIDGAMLRHLNGYLNSKVAPDENYARELQELFTIGKGDDSLYTEEDVMEAARVLTGWRVERNTLEVHLEAHSHDTGVKRFSTFYNSTSISGSSDGIQELDALINMIFATRECSRFICRKLYRWFVNSTIDAATETNVIIPLADMLRSSNFEIKPVLETLLKSEHFFDKANRACYIKSPIDFVVGSIRELEVPVPPYTNYSEGYPLFRRLYETAAYMGMDLLQPPDVNGWPAYHQDPMFYEMWVNSNSLPRRADFTDGLFESNIVDVRLLAARCSDPADADVLVRELTSFLLKYPLSPASLSYIKATFLSGGGTDPDFWRNAWNTNNISVTVPALRNMLRFVTNLPEYHLC